MARSVGLSHAQIIEAAAALADANGLETLTLAQVAQAVGVRLPSLYNHVDGLEGLQRDLALRAATDLITVLGQAAIGKAGDEAVVALATAYRLYAQEHPGRYAATIQAPRANDYAFQELARQLIGIVQAVLAPYHLSEEQNIHAIRGLRSIIYGFATLERLGGFGLPVDSQASFSMLIEMYLVGLHTLAIQNASTLSHVHE